MQGRRQACGGECAEPATDVFRLIMTAAISPSLVQNMRRMGTSPNSTTSRWKRTIGLLWKEQKAAMPRVANGRAVLEFPAPFYFDFAFLLFPSASLSSAVRTCLNSCNDAASARGNRRLSASSVLTIAEAITSRANHL